MYICSINIYMQYLQKTAVPLISVILKTNPGILQTRVYKNNRKNIFLYV